MNSKVWPLLLFAIISLSLLSPLASNQYIPSNDAINHTAGVIQAKMALDQGQFPLRVAPWQHQGLGYAQFQFYSPLPYTVAAAIYKWVVPNNPYLSWKILLWLALTIAGIYWYRLIIQLFDNKPIAILTAFAYLAAPYLLINLHARGDFTEAIGQCLIPVVLYYSFCAYLKKFDIRTFIFTTLAWFALLTTHVITFVWSSIFIGVLFLFLTLIRYGKLSRLIILGLAYVYACLLAAWYLVPIILLKNYINVFIDVWNPIVFNWLTPLPTLLSIVAVSPMPFPGKLAIPLFASVGWIILLAVGTNIYHLFTSDKQIVRQEKYFITILVLLFFIAFILTWGQFNIFYHLPKFLGVQFTYRMLAQVIWPGIFLLAFALVQIFGKNLDGRHILIGLLLIGLASGSWLPSERGTTMVTDLIKKPDLGYAQNGYLVSPNSYKVIAAEQQITKTSKIRSISDIKSSCQMNGYKTICNIKIGHSQRIVQLPLLYYPKLLDIRANGQEIQYMPTNYGKDLLLATIKLNPGSNNVIAYFRGIAWANWLSAITWIITLSLLIFRLVLKPKKYVEKVPVLHESF